MNIYEKLLKVREGFSAAKITKSGQNTFANFNYFELSDIVPTITKLCAEVKALPLINYGQGTATLKFINAEKPDEFIEVTCEMREITNNKMNAAQAYGSIQTYTRRYLYLTMFDIVEPDTLDTLPQGTQDPPKRAAMPPVQEPQPKAQRKPKPGKMSAENKTMMNKLVLSYSKVSGMSVKDTVKTIEDYFETKSADLTDEQAPEVFRLLEKLIIKGMEGVQEAQESA